MFKYFQKITCTTSPKSELTTNYFEGSGDTTTEFSFSSIALNTTIEVTTIQNSSLSNENTSFSIDTTMGPELSTIIDLDTTTEDFSSTKTAYTPSETTTISSTENVVDTTSAENQTSSFVYPVTSTALAVETELTTSPADTTAIMLSTNQYTPSESTMMSSAENVVDTTTAENQTSSFVYPITSTALAVETELTTSPTDTTAIMFSTNQFIVNVATTEDPRPSTFYPILSTASTAGVDLTTSLDDTTTGSSKITLATDQNTRNTATTQSPTEITTKSTTAAVVTTPSLDTTIQSTTSSTTVSSTLPTAGVDLTTSLNDTTTGSSKITLATEQNTRDTATTQSPTETTTKSTTVAVVTTPPVAPLDTTIQSTTSSTTVSSTTNALTCPLSSVSIADKNIEPVPQNTTVNLSQEYIFRCQPGFIQTPADVPLTSTCQSDGLMSELNGSCKTEIVVIQKVTEVVSLIQTTIQTFIPPSIIPKVEDESLVVKQEPPADLTENTMVSLVQEIQLAVVEIQTITNDEVVTKREEVLTQVTNLLMAYSAPVSQLDLDERVIPDVTYDKQSLSVSNAEVVLTSVETVVSQVKKTTTNILKGIESAMSLVKTDTSIETKSFTLSVVSANAQGFFQSTWKPRKARLGGISKRSISQDDSHCDNWDGVLRPVDQSVTVSDVNLRNEFCTKSRSTKLSVIYTSNGTFYAGTNETQETDRVLGDEIIMLQKAYAPGKVNF